MSEFRSMVSIRSAFSILVLTGFTSYGSVVPVSEDEQKDYSIRFEKRQRQTRTLEADLTQTLRLSGIKEPIKSEGHLFYKAPHFLLIRFSKPEGEFVLIRGREVFVKKSGKNLVHRKLSEHSSLRETNILGLLAIFQNVSEFDKDFNVAMERTKNRLFVTLTPKDTSGDRPVILNTLTLPELNIRAIRVTFGQSNNILYEFSNQKRNEEMDSKLFEPPLEE
jgi:outer membrane lipoprotein carrier protein